ncbi:MAG: ZIP family metal transporter [Burkholderiaceae bacterium]|nr:ZIP family metal transporter [Burkholderiaceae bacterium]
MLLTYTLAASIAATLISMLLAAAASLGPLSHAVDRLVSFSAGMLLGTALLHLLPESVHMGGEIHGVSLALLVGLVGFFVLERLAILRHDHHHEHDGHDHPHGHDAESAGQGGWTLLVGSSIHALADGVLIAAAFHADPVLGVLTAVAIATHEVPQQIGNFLVLLNSGFAKSRALFFNMLTGCGSLVGALVGYFYLGQASHWVPYVLVVAAANFIYIALSDLIPQLHAQAHSHHHGGPAKAAWLQPALMLAGIGVAGFAASVLHGH